MFTRQYHFLRLQELSLIGPHVDVVRLLKRQRLSIGLETNQYVFMRVFACALVVLVRFHIHAHVVSRKASFAHT